MKKIFGTAALVVLSLLTVVAIQQTSVPTDTTLEKSGQVSSTVR